MTALLSGFVAAPVFGPEGSVRSLLLMVAVLWPPRVVLSFVLGMRGVLAPADTTGGRTSMG